MPILPLNVISEEVANLQKPVAYQIKRLFWLNSQANIPLDHVFYLLSNVIKQNGRSSKVLP